MAIKNKAVILQFFGYLLIILIMSCLSSFFPLWGNMVLAVIFPIIVLLTKEMVSFEKIKLTTLLGGRILTALTAVYLFPENWLLVIVALLMYINITEAILADAKKKRWENAIAGAAVLATTHLLFTSSWISISESGSVIQIGYYIITHKAIVFWILAYTLWNFNFVTGEFSSSVSLYHIAILSTPLIISFSIGLPGLWVLTRATSLTTAGALQILRKPSIESGLESERFGRFIRTFQKREIQICLMIVVILLSIVSFFY
ncbi:hypothetical protein EXM22_09280 [Oceanispirochaeta crateris]|uniref:Uncharacterized protein n=1 Tax=Oceanispirochaeta crateris TaxID=2518645 RepID=A0A5C1QLG2_9SPIO|nr:hypothetical protein [Oceanispirochaeta crateris]QEN08168.1 hypothetical protein EXM22_09280 [Oceanispirochaeta crateris]